MQAPLLLSRMLFFALASTTIRQASSFLTTATTTTVSRSLAATTTTTARTMTSKSLVVDPFCFRQFAEHEASKNYGGAVFQNTIEEFEAIVNERYQESNLQDGYAPFCKHIFIENNFAPTAKVSVLKITPENEGLLRTTYDARNEKELPVLQRYFPSDAVSESDLPVAKYIDLILYSRDQINLENKSMNKGKDPTIKAPWGIVSIKAQDVNYELPMTPITAMRNALGKDEGGSGVPLVREEYMKAVNYWKDHANIS